MTHCRRCSSPLIQRNRVLLLLVGIAMAATPLIAWFFPLLWAPAVIALLAGGYLIAWATVGKGMWCRQCKTFHFSGQ